MYQEILKFWFEEVDQSQWWKKDEDFDQLIRDKFSAVHSMAVLCELFQWRKNPRGRLAEIIILDQFSRNMFRDTPSAFAYDNMALLLAQDAVSQEIDILLSPIERSFIYLPFMHSESLIIHEIAEELYRQKGSESNLEWEIKHKNIIEKFGRYPHRNDILGRKSTKEELEFLQQPNSSF